MPQVIAWRLSRQQKPSPCEDPRPEEKSSYAGLSHTPRALFRGPLASSGGPIRFSLRPPAHPRMLDSLDLTDAADGRHTARVAIDFSTLPQRVAELKAEPAGPARGKALEELVAELFSALPGVD